MKRTIAERILHLLKDRWCTFETMHHNMKIQINTLRREIWQLQQRGLIEQRSHTIHKRIQLYHKKEG